MYAPPQQQAQDAFGAGTAFVAQFDVTGHIQAHGMRPVKQGANNEHNHRPPVTQDDFGTGGGFLAPISGNDKTNNQGQAVPNMNIAPNPAQHDGDMDSLELLLQGLTAHEVLPIINDTTGTINDNEHDHQLPVTQDDFGTGRGFFAPIGSNDETNDLGQVVPNTNITPNPTQHDDDMDGLELSLHGLTVHEVPPIIANPTSHDQTNGNEHDHWLPVTQDDFGTGGGSLMPIGSNNETNNQGQVVPSTSITPNPTQHDDDMDGLELLLHGLTVHEVPPVINDTTGTINDNIWHQVPQLDINHWLHVRHISQGITDTTPFVELVDQMHVDLMRCAA
ncbi:hypothetical protein GGF41_000501 [Coemansia sp. RSA 2531]|nr:hypothetical protein GGF41_000501 [Coemansia sp. RSA 2531]